jgi:hypothetical protein
MTKQSLRSKYKTLSATERAELFLSTAVPSRDDALDEALRSKDIFDAYNKSAAEVRMIVFGSYWFFKLGVLFGVRLGASGREQCSEEIDDFLDAGPALALALNEFDKAHGGWLRGVAAIMACTETWKQILTIGKMLSSCNYTGFHQLTDQCRQTAESHWEEMIPKA